MTLLSEPYQTAVRPMIKTLDDVRRHVDECFKAADAYTGAGVWIHRCSREEIETQLTRLSGLMHERRDLPLLGMVMSIKDNIDVAGLPTTAGCPAFSFTPQVSATVVQRLCDAGCIVIGKTNMDQFATGLVGTRSPYGACENFFDRKYISGGSTSGSAVATAAGMCDFSLGTDTAGSGRVPAAFNNLVGLKPSRGLLSTNGVIPACRSLDCVCVFARDIDMAERVMAVAEAFDESDIYSRRRSEITTTYAKSFDDGVRVGVPADADLEFFGNAGAANLFASAVAKLPSIGAKHASIDYGPFLETANLLYDGPWVAERLAAIHEFYERHADEMLPITRTIIGGAEKLSAIDAFRGIYQLNACRRHARDQWAHMDLMMLPTAGTIYTIAEVNADPIQLNKNLGYYTNFVNLLDLCALAIPAGFLDTGLPFGVTLIAPAGNEHALLDVAKRFVGGGES